MNIIDKSLYLTAEYPGIRGWVRKHDYGVSTGVLPDNATNGMIQMSNEQEYLMQSMEKKELGQFQTSGNCPRHASETERPDLVIAYRSGHHHLRRVVKASNGGVVRKVHD